tara:strand:+ start:255 stop:746 length:492 start_codon:yes stop_codon:yes gene_type:complete
MHYKQNNKESRTYVQGLRPFGKTLPRTVRGILKKSGYNYSEIVSKWSSLVDKNISESSYPRSIKLAKNNGNGILVIAVKRGNELIVEYSKDTIIRKINSYFGYNLIKNIKLETYNNKHINKSKKQIMINQFSKNFEKKISEVKNENIKNSLIKLIKTIKNDKS